MSLPATSGRKSNRTPYLLCIAAGILVILLTNALFAPAKTVAGEYHYSTILRSNYGVFANVLFGAAGFFAGYLFGKNPWLIGICLWLVYPITALIEATVYRGSHNLIPFELAMFFLMSLP